VLPPARSGRTRRGDRLRTGDRTVNRGCAASSSTVTVVVWCPMRGHPRFERPPHRALGGRRPHRVGEPRLVCPYHTGRIIGASSPSPDPPSTSSSPTKKQPMKAGSLARPPTHPARGQTCFRAYGEGRLWWYQPSNHTHHPRPTRVLRRQFVCVVGDGSSIRPATPAGYQVSTKRGRGNRFVVYPLRQGWIDQRAVYPRDR